MITHITFSGGGIKGFCYLGILRYLYIEKLTDNIKYVSGASIGAYFGLLLALKIPIEYIENEITDIIIKIKKEALLTISKNNFSCLFTSLGFLSLDFLIEPIRKYLKEKYDIEDITFIDFIKKTGINLYVNTTNINTTQRKIFSADDTPDVSVLDAIKASMTVPIIFKPICIDGEYYIDGVISCDLPIDIFKSVPKENKLGIILCQNKDKTYIYEKDIKFDFFTYLFRSFYIMLKNLLTFYSEKYKSKNELYILKIIDLPYDQAFKFKMFDQEINISIEQEDIDNLTLKGFIDVSEYMKKRYNIIN